ncbi:hypothetical protein SAMN05444365_101246 [Micromonospora pattaloongensis]|uniref:Uncharacterized protein n=1 Tax=Micromonospora pattaloongensis TaxID=405436 RepID=A0A1H3G274_9ACTN|nr:hypothetical protein [Micromonospora pattaloongensis]SDX97215.1 hypothetical protein SAMN05444365_101246 [Micromonospora pattaloongensis]
MYEHDGDGTGRDRAERAVADIRGAGAEAWRPAREFAGRLGGHIRAAAVPLRGALGRIPRASRRWPPGVLVAAAGGLLAVAAGLLLRRLGAATPTSGDIGRMTRTGPGRGSGEPGRFGSAGPRAGQPTRTGRPPGPAGLGRAGPSDGRPGPGGLGGLGGRRRTGAESTGRAVPGRSATTASTSYEVPPGQTTAVPASPVDEPVIPAGREAGYPTQPLRRRPGH